MRPRRTHSLYLAFTAAVAQFGVAGVASAVPATPSGGCPQPPNALVITEFMTGPASAPRWVELHNPGKYALSLDKVYLSATALDGSKTGGELYQLGGLVPELPAGESVVFGHVPPQAKTGSEAWLKLKVLEIGSGFQLPPCKGKIVVEGPSGPVDDVSYALCALPADAAPAVMGLEPSLTDLCKNDDMAAWCAATDVGTPGKANGPCDLDGDGFTSVAGDCNDQKKDVYPAAAELCNGADDDCNGQADENLVAPPGTCLAKGVCAGPLKDGTPVAKCEGSAGFVCTYPFGYESVTETLCDGFDNDCDGETDEQLRNVCNLCGPVPAESCNGIDDDCDGVTDEGAATAVDCAGLGVCATAKPVCGPAGIGTCAVPLAHEVTETQCDKLDNDCDGKTDEDMGLGLPCTVGAGACAGPGVTQCGGGGLPVCTGAAFPPASELCGDGLDNNCDGETDEGFAIGKQCVAGVGICRVVGKKVCGGDRKSSTCNIKPAAADAEDRCGNGLDDDCDGQTDEAGCTDAAGDGWQCAADGTVGNSGGPGAWLLACVAALVLAVRRRAA